VESLVWNPVVVVPGVTSAIAVPGKSGYTGNATRNTAVSFWVMTATKRDGFHFPEDLELCRQVTSAYHDHTNGNT